MGLRDFYYSLENKYYGLLDKLDKSGIKVYKVVDKIDKVIPSFVLVIILFGLIIAGIIIGLLSVFNIGFPNDPITFVFTDKHGENFSNQVVSYSFNGESRGFLETDALGVIYFDSAKSGDVFAFEIPKGNSVETITRTITKDRLYNIKLNFSLAQDSVNFTVNSIDNLALKPINIYFVCANANAVVPASRINSIDSTYNISFDSDCGVLSANIKSNYYEEAYQEIYSGVNINLRPNDYSGNMQITVNIYDESNLPIAGDASVNISQNGFPIKYGNRVSESVYTFTGLSAATYVVNVTKSGYASQNQTVVLDGSTTTQNISMYLKKTSGLGNFVLKIVGIDGKAIKDVSVIVKSQDESGNQKEIVSQGKTDASGNIDLDVPDISQKYWILASKTGYTSLSRSNVSISETQLTLVMRKTNEANLLRVKIFDEFGFAVNNANVALMDANDNVIAPYFGVTDFNGIAKNSAENGTYKVYVYKGSFSGMSELFSYDSDALNANEYVIVNLSLPRAGWDITLKDSFGLPVPNALITLYDAYNYEPIEIGNRYASPEGTLSIQNLRVDRKYFIVASANSFENYISKSKFLTANGLAVDNFVMEKQKTDSRIKVEAIGTYDLENNKVYKLASNTEYVSRFKITLPKGEINYEDLFANFVLGSLDAVEKEPIYIKKVEYSGNANLMKGRNYSENNIEKSIGDTKSFDNVIYDGSPFQDQIKWVQLTWDLESHNIDSGILFVDVHMQVRAGVQDGVKSDLSFNILAKEDEYYSSPENLSSEESNSGLFAPKNKIFFVVGEGQQVCDDLFCFEGSYLDLTDDLKSSVMGELPYVAKLGRNYKLNFSLVNNRDVPLTNYRVIIENPQKSLEMNSGIIYSASNVKDIKPDANKFADNFSFPFRDVATLNQNGAIKGDINFIPIAEGSNSFKITVIEDREIIYTKEFYVSVVANKEIFVEIIPEVLPSYVDSNIKFIVKDFDNNAYLEDAFVRIVNVYDSELASGSTNEFGEIVLEILGQNPNTDLYMKVYKEEYRAFEKVLRTSDKFITIDPKELSVKANVFEMKGQGVLNLKNTSRLPVVIESIVVEGNFDEYVNLLETNNYLENSSKDLVMDKEHNYDVPVNVSLTTIASYLKESIEYEGKVIITVRPKDLDLETTRSWTYEVPLKLFISLGKGLDNLDCLGLDKTKSEIVSNNGKNDSDSLTVVNGCTVDGVPVKIRNLEAKITWKGNALGAFTFVKNEISSRIQSAYYVTLLTTMLDHEESMFVLNFNPATGRIAGTNTAEIELRASYFTDNGIEFISKKTEYTVSVVDMQACISYDLPDAEVDLIKVPRDSTVQFKVRNDCDTGFDVLLTDLPKEFIDVRPNDFTLPAKSEVTVTIDPNTSPVGVYLLEVRGKTSKESFNGVRVGSEALRVFVAPLETDCLVMDNYEFNLGKSDENRYAYLINRCYYKDIQAMYDIEVKSNEGCTKQNWAGIIKAALGGAITSVVAGASYGEIFGTNKVRDATQPEKTAKELDADIGAAEKDVTKAQKALNKAKSCRNKCTDAQNRDIQIAQAELNRLKIKKTELQNQFDTLVGTQAAAAQAAAKKAESLPGDDIPGSTGLVAQ